MDKLPLGILIFLVVVVINNPIANPIANMYGPYFLLFYGFVIVVTLVTCWWNLRRGDGTANLPLPFVPAEPDPYEIAYLRDGENELIRLVIFDLIQRDYLHLQEQRIEQAPKHPNSNFLTPIEHDVFRWFSSPRKPSDVFQSSLPVRVTQHCTIYRERLQNEKLLYPDEVKAAAGYFTLTGSLIILGLGGYKLLVALAKGHSNVLFLVIMGIVSLIILMNICQTPRLSQRGRAYLERLQQTFEQLKGQASTVKPMTTHISLLLPVALFGTGILAGTIYADFEKIFHQSAASDGGDGGGDGGGGGCGGGGCGGCGG